MSLELPAIPPQPAADAPAAEWSLYLQILGLHSAAAGQQASAATAQAIRDQTAQMALMTAASQAHAALMQQLLDQPVPAGSDGAARVAMAALLSESGTDRQPAEVATAVLARVAAVDTMLGG